MKKKQTLTYIKNIILPCILLSGVTGAFTGLLIFCFKYVSGQVIELSDKIYSYAQDKPVIILPIVAGCIVLSVISAAILRFSPDSRGGGIPTAIAILRGLITFSWVKSIFCVFFSSLVSYMAGVPLGNEGPSVQMGTGVGSAAVNIFAGKHKAWERYSMTAGACAGFASATGAPVSGVFFALEEAHRRFSPMIVMTASVSVACGSLLSSALCRLAGISVLSFDIDIPYAMGFSYFWVAVVAGLLCGFYAALYTKIFKVIRSLINDKMSKLPHFLKVMSIFVLVALIGNISHDCIGSGHSLAQAIFENNVSWYLALVYLVVRTLLVVAANNAGITGGLFVPTLIFGALIGTLTAKALIYPGLLPEQYYLITVVICMISFLGASVKTPITAIVFSMEALSAIRNVPFVIIGVITAYIVVETMGIISSNDLSIEQKVHDLNSGRRKIAVDTVITAKSGCFAIGKEPRDILWPPYCIIVSMKKNESDDGKSYTGAISENDQLAVHFQTYDTAKTAKELCYILGDQNIYESAVIRSEGENQNIPE